MFRAVERFDTCEPPVLCSRKNWGELPIAIWRHVWAAVGLDRQFCGTLPHTLRDRNLFWFNNSAMIGLRVR